MSNTNPAIFQVVTANATIKTKPGVLRGFYVASTSAGTIQFFDSIDNSGTPLTGVITPGVGSHNLHDIAFTKALYAQVTGTLSATVAHWL